MTVKRLFITLLVMLPGVGIGFLSVPSPAAAEAQKAKAYDAEEALKVIRLLAEIQMESNRTISADGSRSKAVVTEQQLNDYIAYRIDSEHEEIMRELRLKLFPKNKIEGRVLIDLRGESIPSILNPEMVLYFGGRVETRDRAVRLRLDSLFLGEQSIQPEILDLIMAIAAGIRNEEAVTLKDWWELPFGIRDIQTEREKLWLFY